MADFEQKMVVLSAPSGCGKTTLARGLLEAVSVLSFSVSACTRPPRPGEQAGVSYYFMSEADFHAEIERGAYLEWEEVYKGQYYGTLYKEIDRLAALHKHILFDIDVQGGLRVKSKAQQRVLSIFIQPPSLQVLEERLRSRGTEDEASISKRLSKAEQELKAASRFDLILTNDDQQRATEALVRATRQFLYPVPCA